MYGGLSLDCMYCVQLVYMSIISSVELYLNYYSFM